MADGDSYSIHIDTSALAKEAQEAANIIDGIAKSAQNTGGKIDSALGNNSFGDKIENEANQANSAVKGIGDTAQQAGNQMSSAFANAGTIMAAYFSVQKLTEFAKAVIDVRGQIEGLEISFKTLLGDEQKANNLFSQLREFAVNTPMQLKDLASGAQTMLGFGIDDSKVMEYLKELGDISMGDTQKFQSLTLAFSQVTAAGKLQGQDLLQLINSGFNPLNEIAKQTGKSISELKDDMSKGQISAEMLAGALKSATSEGGQFSGMLEKQSKGINGAISNLQGAWDDMLNDIGENTQSIFVDGVNGLSAMVKHYEGFLSVLSGVIAAYGTYKAAMLAVVAVQKAQNIAQAISLTLQLAKTLGFATAAQQAFNTAAKMNPYVMLATVIAGAAATIYTFTSLTNDATDAQKDANSAIEEAGNLEKERNTKAQELLNTLQDSTAEEIDRTKALQELRKEYPKIFEKYDTENIKLANQLGLLKQINDENRKRAGYKVTGELNSTNKKIDELENDPWHDNRKELNELYKKRDALMQQKGKTESASFETLFGKVDNKTLDTYKAEIQRRINQAQKQGKDKITMRLPIDVKGTLGDEATYSIKDLESLVKSISQQKTTNNTPVDNDYGKKYRAAEKAWKQATAARANIEKNRDKFTTAQYTEAVKAEKDAKEAFEALGGTTGKSTKTKTTTKSTAQTEAQKLAKETADYERELAKQTEEKKRAQQDAADKLEQAKIDALAEGSEKTQRQQELDFKKEQQQLERQRADELQKAKDQAKSNFERNPQNKGKTYSGDADVEKQYNADNSKYWEEMEEALLQKQAQIAAQAKANEREQMNAYLASFGSYTEQMEAISSHYADMLAKAKTDGEKQTIAANAAQDIADVQSKYREGLDGMSTSNLQSMIDMLNNVVAANQSAFSAEQLANYKTQIDALTDELNERNPFQVLKNAASELNAAEAEVQAAMDNLADKKNATAEAQSNYNIVKSGGSVMNSDNTTMTLTQAEQNLANAKKEEAKASQQMTAAFEKENKVKEKVRKADNKVVSSINKLSSALGDVGDAIGGTAGDIIGIVSTIGTTVTSSIEGMKAASDAGATAIQNVERASVILAIISAAIQVVTKIANMLSAANDAALQDDIDALQDRIDKLQDSYEDLQDQVEKTFSSVKQGNIEKQIENEQQQIELIYRQIRDERNKKSSDDDAIDEYEDKIKDLEDDIKELKEAAVDAIFGEDITSAIENFAENYADAWSSGESKAKSVKDTIKTMMKSMVTESIKSAIQASSSMEQIRAKLAEFYSDEVLTGWEQDYIYKMADSLQKDLDKQFAWADSLLSNDSEQSSTSGGFATASQDSVDELNGRFTAVQMNTSDIAEKMASVVALNTEATEHLMQIRLQTEQSLSYAQEAVSYLGAIAKNTNELYSMNERLDKIEQNTRTL